MGKIKTPGPFGKTIAKIDGDKVKTPGLFGKTIGKKK